MWGKIKIIKYSKIWLTFSFLLVLSAIFSLIMFKLNFSIDFTGGSVLSVKMEKSPPLFEIRQTLGGLNIPEINIRSQADNVYVFRTSLLSEEQHQKIIEVLVKKFGKVEDLRFESIGPLIGNELKKKSLYAVAVASVMIIVYLALAFKKATGFVSSWSFGVIAVIALLHDLIITMGVFAVLGKFLGVTIDSLFVTALLTILGYSVHDTIVIFNRIKENLSKYAGKFSDIVDKSIQQTMTRSIHTSLTTLLPLASIYVFGGESIRFFALALIIGIIVGTYSSIFVAPPLLVIWQKRK